MRDVVAPLAPTEYAMVPGPLPVAPAVMVIQFALAVALQEQLAPAVTATVPLPPSLLIVSAPGEIAYVQTGVGSVGDAFSLHAITLAESAIASDT